MDVEVESYTGFTKEMFSPRSLILYARSALISLYGLDESEALTEEEVSAHCRLDQSTPYARVNVTLRTNGILRGSMSGTGTTLGEQLRSAVILSSMDSRFTGAIVSSEVASVMIEVWLQTDGEEISLEARSEPNAFQLGIEGVEIRENNAFAYYKPSVAITSNISSAQQLFRRLCRKAKIDDKKWMQPSVSLRKTNWVHICETPGGDASAMRALRPIEEDRLTRATVGQWLNECVQYLIANQDAEGGFCYQYDPIRNTANPNSSNSVRASGCAYSIALAASNEHVLNLSSANQSAERAIESILRRAVHSEDGTIYIADNRQRKGGKLGTTALFLLALLSPSQRDRHEETICGLIAAIAKHQDPTGRFACVFGECEQRASHDDFFPGQAILAMALRAASGDSECTQIYRRAFSVYRDHFRKRPATAFVGWQADAWSRISRLDGCHDYAEFVFEQIDWLLQYQLHNHVQEIYFGGFSWNGKPPSYSSIVYTEAIARAAALAHERGDQRWHLYKDAFRAGLAFCLRLRHRAEQSIYFPAPARSIGGIAENLTRFQVRSDFVQHAITLAMASLDSPFLLD
jgi:AMMECR1 domain-containing protein